MSRLNRFRRPQATLMYLALLLVGSLVFGLVATPAADINAEPQAIEIPCESEALSHVSHWIDKTECS